MSQCKYIVVANDFSGEMIFPFLGNISHKQMFNAVKKMGYKELISAGFVDEFMNCYGDSFTLKKGSRDIDTILLKTMFELNDKRITFE